MNLKVDDGIMNGLINSDKGTDVKMMDCLQAYFNDGSASWTELTKAVVKYPVSNKLVAKEIAEKHGLDFNRILQDLRMKDEL